MTKYKITIPCRGYIGTRWHTHGSDDYYADCPELDRRQGLRPGTGKGYPENWARPCITCKNSATETIEHEIIRMEVV